MGQRYAADVRIPPLFLDDGRLPKHTDNWIPIELVSAKFAAFVIPFPQKYKLYEA